MRIEASVIIECPRQAVYEFLGTPEKTPTYWEHMTSYRATSPPPFGEGTTMEGTMKFGPITARLNQVVTRATDDVIEWRDVNTHLPSVQSFTLNEVPGGTRVVYRYVGDPQDVAGRALAPLLTITTQRDAWKSMDRLKEILESH